MYRSSFCESLGQLTAIDTGGYDHQFLINVLLTKGMSNSLSNWFFIQHCLAHFSDRCLGLSIDSHNVQIYSVKGKWHNRRHLYYIFRTPNQGMGFVTEKSHKVMCD